MTISALGDLVPRIAPTAWVHPDATIVGDVEIGERSSIWPGAVLRGDFGAIRIGARTSIQDNVVIHAAPYAPTVVGDGCIVAHLAFIETAIVEDDCMVAVAAQMLPGSILRRGTVAAAGAVLAAGLEVPSGHRAQGVPARIVPSDHPDPAYIAEGAANYARMVDRYVAAGIGSTGAELVASGVALPTADADRSPCVALPTADADRSSGPVPTTRSPDSALPLDSAAGDKYGT